MFIGQGIKYPPIELSKKQKEKCYCYFESTFTELSGDGKRVIRNSSAAGSSSALGSTARALELHGLGTVRLHHWLDLMLGKITYFLLVHL